MMQFTGERCVPWDRRQGAHLLTAHVMRYAWAMPFVYGKSVVDLGCGAGYGSFMLSWGARSVVGVDVDPVAIRFAQDRFESLNLEYRTADIMTSTLPQAEVYTAFEVLEHVDDPMALIPRLPAGSALMWSMPINDGSKFHKRAYSIDEIRGMLRDGWWQDIHGQITAKNEAWFDDPTYVLGYEVIGGRQ